MENRSTGNIVKVFVVVPILLGGIILTVIVVNAVKFADDLTTREWLLQVVAGGCLALAVMVILPVVGIAELRKRKRARQAGAAPPPEPKPRRKRRAGRRGK
jgi:hypothetical protein